jgi:hypothetical protein
MMNGLQNPKLQRNRLVRRDLTLSYHLCRSRERLGMAEGCHSLRVEDRG